MFRKRDRRERTVAVPTHALPQSASSSSDSPHPLPAPLPNEAYASGEQSTSSERPVHERDSFTQSIPTLIKSPFALPRVVHGANTQDINSHPLPHPAQISALPPAAPRLSQGVHQRCNTADPNGNPQFQSLDENNRVYLHDWYWRAGPMAQGLLNLKNRREGK